MSSSERAPATSDCGGEVEWGGVGENVCGAFVGEWSGRPVQRTTRSRVISRLSEMEVVAEREDRADRRRDDPLLLERILQAYVAVVPLPRDF